MKRAFRIFGWIIFALFAVIVLRRCDFGSATNRPDLDLALAPQMVNPAEVPRDVNMPPMNQMSGGGVNAMPHGEPAQQDSTLLPGPIDQTRRLKESELVYRFMGPGYFGAFNSALYPDGGRALWANGVNGLYKLDYETYEIYDHVPTPEAAKYTRDWADGITASLDKNNSGLAMRTAMKAVMPLRTLSGVYAVVGTNNWFYKANKDGSIQAYGDVVEGDRTSKIVLKAEFQMPDGEAGPSVGMNMTFDGWIVFPTENGYMIAVSPDLKEYRSVRMTHADREDLSSTGPGYGWVRNSIAVDKDGGIYVASRNHMYKIVWTGDDLSVDPADGAWAAEYRNGTGQGTGATPSLMGFGEEDKFVVITDGDIRMNVTLFWRDDIPDDWEALPGAPSRRIAGLAPANMGAMDAQDIQSEQTVIVAGYGALVVNNTGRNIPFYMPKKGPGRALAIGPLVSNPDFQPYGVQKFQWDPTARQFKQAWVNERISSPNGVPWVSLGSEQVYFMGARNNEWTLEAVNWFTGEPTFHYILGGQKI